MLDGFSCNDFVCARERASRVLNDAVVFATKGSRESRLMYAYLRTWMRVLLAWAVQLGKVVWAHTKIRKNTLEHESAHKIYAYTNDDTPQSYT